MTSIIKSLEELAEQLNREIHPLKPNPAEPYMYIQTAEEGIFLWDGQKAEHLIKKCQPNGITIGAIGWAPDGNSIIVRETITKKKSGYMDYTYQYVNISLDGIRKHLINLNHDEGDPIILPNNTMVLKDKISHSPYKDRLISLDLNTKEVYEYSDTGRGADGPHAVSPTGKYVLGGSWDDSHYHCVYTKGGYPRKILEEFDHINDAVALSEPHFIVKLRDNSGYPETGLYLVDVEDDSYKFLIEGVQPVISPDKSILAFKDFDREPGIIYIFDLKKMKEVPCSEIPQNTLGKICEISPCSRYISGAYGSSLEIAHLETGELHKFQIPESTINHQWRPR